MRHIAQDRHSLTRADDGFLGTSSGTWEASTDDRNRLVKQVIRDHYRAHKGHVVPFGAILVTIPGYLVDFGYPFDTDGNSAGPMQEVKRLGEASLGIRSGDARLTGLLRNTEIKESYWVPIQEFRRRSPSSARVKRLNDVDDANTRQALSIAALPDLPAAESSTDSRCLPRRRR